MIPQAAPSLRIARFRLEIDDALSRVLSGNSYILGPNVEAFEAEFASFCDIGHCVGVANGTDALALALRGVGVASGDEVITSALTKPALSRALSMLIRELAALIRPRSPTPSRRAPPPSFPSISSAIRATCRH
jgi:dTDP-4-amino-4,6-dideoxygalactose transaminase